jgi:hypothetical protein
MVALISIFFVEFPPLLLGSSFLSLCALQINFLRVSALEDSFISVLIKKIMNVISENNEVFNASVSVQTIERHFGLVMESRSDNFLY